MTLQTIVKNNKEKKDKKLEKVLSEEEYYKLFSKVMEQIFEKLKPPFHTHIYQHLLTIFEKAVISLALKKTNSNQVKASKLLGISRNTLRDRMKKYNLS